MIYLSGKHTSHSSHRMFFNFLFFFPGKPPTYTKKDEQGEIICGKFFQRVDQNHLTMESFTLELVANASAKQFPRQYTHLHCIFLPEQLILEGKGEVAISEICYPSMYQNVTEGKFVFLTQNFRTLGIVLSGTRSLPFKYRFCGSHEDALSRKTKLHRNLYRSQTVSKNTNS